jgi:4-carboxymuconolactone decarboxylase
MMLDNVVDDRVAADGDEVFRRLATAGATAPWESLADLAPALGAEVRHSLGAVMGRPGLDLRTREIATICMLAALGGCEPQLAFHIGGALRSGASVGEVVEALTQVSLYAGFPRTINAMQVARQVFEEQGLSPESE